MNRICRIFILLFFTIVYSGCKQEEKKAVIQPKEEIKKLNEVSTGNIHDGPVYSAKAE